MEQLGTCHFSIKELTTLPPGSLEHVTKFFDRLCGLVVRILGYRSRDSRRYLIFREVVGLERDLLSLLSITEELLEKKSSASGSRKLRLTAIQIRCADHATPSIRKSWH
jgi:hypothetical protein